MIRTYSRSILYGTILLFNLGMAQAAPTLRPDSIRVEVFPAWKGLIHGSRPGEIRLVFYTERGGHYLFDIITDEQRLTIDTALEAGRTRDITLTITHPLQGKLNIHHQGQLIYPGTGETAHFTHIPSRQIVIATAKTIQHMVSPQPGYYLATVTAKDFPRTPGGYQGIDVLITSPAEIAQLDAAQLWALYGHIQQCGKVLIIPMAKDSSTARLPAATHCPHSPTYTSINPSDIKQSIQQLIHHDPSSTLNPIKALASLADTEKPHAIARQAGWFLIIYTTLILIIGLIKTRPVLQITIVFGASLTLGLFFWGTTADKGLFLIIHESNGLPARYLTGILDITGNGRSKTRTQLPPSIWPSQPWSGLPSEIKFHLPIARVQPIPDLINKTHLSSRHRWIINGWLMNLPEWSTAGNSHSLRISNPGADTNPAATLVWNNQCLRLPTIKPEATWSAHSRSHPISTRLCRRLLLLPLSTTGPFIALPIAHLQPPWQTQLFQATQHGWLIFRTTHKVIPYE